jgi:hypothetical protein
VSTVSATVLTSIFGIIFFVDNSELAFGLPNRTFTSFNGAAKEAAMSRFYGGIHYRASIENGMVQGQNIGNYVVNKLKMLK